MKNRDTISTAHLAREYDRLSGEMMEYFRSIVSTERAAILSAAGVVAFLYTDLPEIAAGQARVIAAVPATIIALAGLRCLSIFATMLTSSRYLRRIEQELLDDPAFGLQQVFEVRRSRAFWLILGSTTLFWAVALGAAVYFWAVFEPVAG